MSPTVMVPVAVAAYLVLGVGAWRGLQPDPDDPMDPQIPVPWPVILEWPLIYGWALLTLPWVLWHLRRRP